MDARAILIRILERADTPPAWVAHRLEGMNAVEREFATARVWSWLESQIHKPWPEYDL